MIHINVVNYSYVSNVSDVDLPKNLMMTWDDLRSLKSERVELGSHTVTHPPLATVEDENELEIEIAGSRKIMKDNLGYNPVTISYPVGSYSPRVKEMSRKAGYQIGLAVDHVLYDNNKRDHFAIPRIEMYNDSYFRNVLRIRGIEAFVKSIVR